MPGVVAVGLDGLRARCLRVGVLLAISVPATAPMAHGGTAADADRVGARGQAQGAASPGLGSMPAVSGETLAGGRVQLPRDLSPLPGRPGGGRMAVLVVGFSRAASGPARAWGERLAADTERSEAVTYFELPVLAGVPRLLRSGVLRLMEGSVKGTGREHFLPITENEAAWRRVVEFRDPDVPYLLVVDDGGEVRWRSSGAFSEPAYAALCAQVRALEH